MQTGQALIGERLLSAHANEDPLFGIDSIPFLASSFEASGKLWDAAEGAIAEALDTLLEQDSPFARSLVDELQPHVGFAEVQHRLLGQATAWKERSSALQARLARARDRQP